MTGTERAAHRLALGLLRRSIADAWLGRDSHGEHLHEARAHEVLVVVWGLYDDARMPDHAAWVAGILDERPASGWRPARARLALYLRALLRADELERAAEPLSADCEEDDIDATALGELRRWDARPYFRVGARLARPLWVAAGAGR